MKKLFIILFVCLSVSGYGQLIGTNRIKDGAITSPKLNNGAVTKEKMATDAIAPLAGGTLSDFSLNFVSQYGQIFDLTVDEDIALTLEGSGNVNNTWIIINATGDGSHVLTWPATWRIEGTYDPNSVQEVYLKFNGSTVIGKITVWADAIEATVTAAAVTNATPTTLNLTFSEAVNIDATGWTLSASGGAVNILGVAASGTMNPTFTLSREIIFSETVTISYAPAAGQTTNLSGNEIETIVNQAVAVPDEEDPVTQNIDIYVDDDAADDIAAGTIGDPFKTIQAGSNAATAGQIVGIKGGTYRETPVAKADVTYTNVIGEVAFISGFEDVGTTGWTVHSGNIYKKTITLPVNGFNTSTTRIAENSLNTTIFANQILRNGEMMFEARWPNITTFVDMMDRTKFRSLRWDAGFNDNNIVDATLPTSAANLVGGTVVANGWFMTEPRTINSNTGTTQINFNNIWDNTATGQWSRQRYYLTGKLVLLDAEKEWHYESGTLYFWQPGGGTPTGTIVYKARNWGFDARGKANVKIISPDGGLRFIGCEPFVGDASSTGAVIDNIRSTFQNHHVRHDVWEWQGVGMSKQFGIKLLGANSVVKNSEFSFSGSSGIWCGPNALIQNNYFHDWGYVGYWANPISLWGTDGGQTITYNTTERTGRSGFDFGYNFGNAPGTSNHYNVTVSYNDFGYYGMLSSDNGGTYTWGQCDLFNLQYHHNWIHDNMAPGQATGVTTGNGLQAAIYFDQSTGPGEISYNVTWNAGDTDVYHETVNPTRPGSNPALWTRPYPLLNIHHNTFATTTGSVDGSVTAYRSYILDPKDTQTKNIYRRQIVVSWGGPTSHVTSSVMPGTDPLFVGGDPDVIGGLAFKLQSGSPAIALDAGAYPFGGEDWIPGYVPFVEDNTVNDNDAGWTYTAGWDYQPNAYNGQRFVNFDHHLTSTVGANATYNFHGTQVTVTAEKCDNMGVARISVLDGAVVMDTDDVNLFQETGSGLCDAGVVDVVWTSIVLAEDDYTVKVELLSGSTLVLDAIEITP